jgi:hypothetical protein
MTTNELDHIFKSKADQAGQETGPYAAGMVAAYEDAAETVHDAILSSVGEEIWKGKAEEVADRLEHFEAASVQLLGEARMERDRARDLAVRLEQELAHVEGES